MEIVSVPGQIMSSRRKISQRTKTLQDEFIILALNVKQKIIGVFAIVISGQPAFMRILFNSIVSRTTMTCRLHNRISYSKDMFNYKATCSPKTMASTQIRR